VLFGLTYKNSGGTIYTYIKCGTNAKIEETRTMQDFHIDVVEVVENSQHAVE
jgi:hypothetical protein